MTITLSMGATWLPDRASRNVIFELRGTGPKADEIGVVMGGHIDSWDNARGAMDDGGGVIAAWIAVKALAELAAKDPSFALARTVRAVAWVNEENGDRGGEAYARDNAGELAKTSIAIECDEGSFEPRALGFTAVQAVRHARRHVQRGLHHRRDVPAAAGR
jgi:carboxypeptidase Q